MDTVQELWRTFQEASVTDVAERVVLILGCIVWGYIIWSIRRRK